MKAEGWGQGSRQVHRFTSQMWGLNVDDNMNKSKAHGRPWDTAVGWNLAPWPGEHPHVEDNY